jgi:hypothetical protein
MRPGLQKPFFLVLLPAFFFIHVLNENFNPVLIKDAVKLILFYSVISLFLTGIAWLYFRDLLKAALFAFSCLAVDFFFGPVQDLLQKSIPGSFFLRYSFILPFLFVLLILLIVYLKRSRLHFQRTTRYLNLLLLLLLFLDAGMLIANCLKNKPLQVSPMSGSWISCDSCSKPDVYLIIADEYAGRKELEDLFSFNNQGFENELQQRGFHIVQDPMANYNATVYSMASLLNMDYLHHLQNTRVNYRDMLTCSGLINHNNLVGFFKTNGYKIYNYSFFDLDGQERPVKNFFYPSNTALLSFQTLTSRLNRTLGYHLFSDNKVERIRRNDMYSNATIDRLTRSQVLQKKNSPAFVYTHLNLPHHGYFYDSNGIMTPVAALTDEFTMDKNAYISYLKYSNRKLLELIDHIKKNTAAPPVIILMSDHGFRQLPGGTGQRYYFMNLNAVYLPGGNYTGFYDGMSNVNQFRVILNSQFHQKLPLLKDSTSFLVE